MNITRSHTMSPAFLNMFQTAEWGTSGPIFRMKNLDQSLVEIPNPEYYSLDDNGELAGGGIVSRGKQKLYLSSLFVKQSHRSMGLGRKYLDYIDANNTDVPITYGIVEGGNDASLRMCANAGFKTIGSVDSHFYSRIFPRPSDKIFRVGPESLEEIASLLSSQNPNNPINDYAKPVEEGNYFAIFEGGKIMAAAEIKRVCWEFLQMPGRSGFILKYMAPFIPFVRKKVDLSQYASLSIGNIYVAKGAKDYFYRLLEGVMASEGVAMALFCTDPRSETQKTLPENVNMGFFGGALGQIHYLGKWNLEGEEEKMMLDNPILVSVASWNSGTKLQAKYATYA